jgi:hypothetical protein
MRFTALIAALLAGAGLTAPAASLAQSPKRPSVEFALLSSVNYVIRYRGYLLGQYVWDGPSITFYDKGLEDHYTAVTFPSVAPGLRVTFWSRSQILIDAAMSWMRLRSEGGETNDNLMFELGVGADLARREGTEHPFVGFLTGFAVLENGDPVPYIGAQLGLRHFIRDYAALRVQLGYRATLNRHEDDLRSIEIACGIGFFL